MLRFPKSTERFNSQSQWAHLVHLLRGNKSSFIDFVSVAAIIFSAIF